MHYKIWYWTILLLFFIFTYTFINKLGVCIESINDNGSIKQNKKVYNGLYLIQINNNDVKYSTFDEVMSILIDHPIENKLDLIFIDPRNVMKGNAELTVQTMDNQVIKINTLKGLILRNVLRDNNIEIYTGKNKIGWW